jgi:hypothetical protein
VCCIVLYLAVQYCAVLYRAALCCAVLYRVVLCCAVLCCFVIVRIAQVCVKLCEICLASGWPMASIHGYPKTKAAPAAAAPDGPAPTYTGVFGCSMPVPVLHNWLRKIVDQRLYHKSCSVDLSCGMVSYAGAMV